MAREYARIRTSIADDPDLEDLSLEAQWLYFRVILPDPTLSSVGVMDWRPRKLIRKATAPSAISQHQEGGYVTGERHLGAAPERIAPTPQSSATGSTPFCERHPEGTPDPCRGCADARRRYDATRTGLAEAAETARRHAEARAQSEAAQQRAADAAAERAAIEAQHYGPLFDVGEVP
jgi:hypothetical protein